ncbi:hypothetical protein [Ferrimonas gelatinilytica]|uniref:hypothetical protein n=1 Tax=Ferrimonas gelatinilytica TaxID=1255257 RepID=UPI0031F032FB
MTSPTPAFGNGRFVSLIVGVFVTAVVAMIGYRVYDAQQRIRVVVVAPNGDTQSYIVKKGDIDRRRFVTEAGLEIQLGAEDRLELRPVDP